MHKLKLKLSNRERRTRNTKLSITACVMLMAAHVQAQDLPTPLQFVSQADFECRRAAGPAPQPQQLMLRQLNPVLQNQIPPQQVVLGQLEEVCVPVMKDQHLPDPQTLAIQRWIDLACHQAQAAPIQVDVELSHLNPVLSDLPDERVTMTRLRQLCVPVAKDQRLPPDPVRNFVRYFDLGCYELEEPTSDVQRELELAHLNPVLREADLADDKVRIRRARQLCVPVRKNNQDIPDAVHALVRWADFLKYRAATPEPVAPLPLDIRHLNPLFAGSPDFETVLLSPLRLMVPVAKDHQLPPD